MASTRHILSEQGTTSGWTDTPAFGRRHIKTPCDLCGEECDVNRDICKSFTCANYRECSPENNIYHQACVEKYLKAIGQPKDRLTGFVCPRGSSKHTSFPDSPRCTGRIDKSHQTIPKNEKRVAKLATPVAPAVKPQLQQPQTHMVHRKAAVMAAPHTKTAAYQQAKYDNLGLLVPLAPVDGQSETSNSVLVGMDDTGGMGKAQKKNAKRAAAAAAKKNSAMAAVNGGPSVDIGGPSNGGGGGGGGGPAETEEWQSFADFPDSDNLSMDGYEYNRDNTDYTSAVQIEQPAAQPATVVPAGFAMDLERYNALFFSSNVPAPAPAIKLAPPVPYTSNIANVVAVKAQSAAVHPLGAAAPVKINRPLFMTPDQIAALVAAQAAAAAGKAVPMAAAVAAPAAAAITTTEHELRDFPISPGSSASDEADTLLASIVPALGLVARGAAAVAAVSSDVSDDDSDEEGELTMEQMMALCST